MRDDRAYPSYNPSLNLRLNATHRLQGVKSVREPEPADWANSERTSDRPRPGHTGWLYLSVVIDLFSRRVVGWSAQPRMTTDWSLQALLAAVWRRKAKAKVMIHSDQGSQFTSREWQLFLSQHNLDASMSRRGNCHDRAIGRHCSSPMARAVAESFFQLLKRERIRRRTYLTREAARQDVLEYIEMFYNPKRKHTNNGMLSTVDFETRQHKLNKAGV